MIVWIITILKIIGIILLCLLAVCLLTVSVVLFVPIRYRAGVSAASDRPEHLEAHFKISWAANLIRMIADWQGNNYHIYAKFLWFSLYDSAKPMDDPANAFTRYILRKQGLYEQPEPQNAAGTAGQQPLSSGEAKRAPSGTEGGSSDGKEPVKERQPRQSFSERKVQQEDRQTGGRTEEKPENAGETLFEIWKKKISAKYQKLQFLFQSICDKIKRIKKEINQITELFGQDFTCSALANLFQKLWRLVCYVFPDKLKGEISFGIEDNPEMMGKILMWLGIFYPVYGRQIAVHPYFDKSFYDVKLGLKGCVRIYRPIYYLLGILLNRDSIRLIQYLREAGGDKNG